MILAEDRKEGSAGLQENAASYHGYASGAGRHAGEVVEVTVDNRQESKQWFSGHHGEVEVDTK